MADAINRVRPPFNLNGAAIAAGVAALEDAAHVEARSRTTPAGCPGSANRSPSSGSRSRRASANFLLLEFGRNGVRSAAEADAYLSARGYILRAVGAYGLPECLRLTVGDEEANRGVVEALTDFVQRTVVAERLGPPLDQPVFGDLAIIGVGLIGSSLARAIRKQNAARRIVVADASRLTLWPAPRLSVSATPIRADLAEAVADADCVILCAPVGANAEIGRAIGPALKTGAIVSDVGSVKSRGDRGARTAFCRRMPGSSRPIRSPAPSSPARTRASPRCSSIAGPF